MQILGILGGVACGKSTVARELATRGAVILNADRAGHEALTEPDVKQALVTRWGDSILNSAGEIDRPSVARIVFAPDGLIERHFLERITHPRIRHRLEAQLEEFRRSPQPPALVILDAALLLEANWDSLCDHLLFVDAPREARLARARTRGWSDEEFDRREAAQLSVEEKRRRCGLTIDNSGSAAEMPGKIAAIWDEIQKTKIAAN